MPTSNMIWACVLFTLGQALGWFHLNAQFVWEWWKPRPILALFAFSFPAGLCFWKGMQMAFEENGYDNPMTPEFFQELNEILRELNQLYLDDVFPDFFREAELPGPMATNPMPNVQPTQVAQVLPQTGGLTQTEAALLSGFHP